MQNLNLALFQLDLVWEKPEANRQKIEKLYHSLDTKADILVLPEMFSTGFTMHSSAVAESKPYPTLEWMKRFSNENNVAMIGSIVAEENAAFYNRLFFVKPDGETSTYDKRHLFRMANENEHYSPGAQKLIVEYKSWRICPLICYDLRFPVWSRNRNDYDLLVFVANWPKARSSAWQTLLKARAIENYAYCAGVNRVGFDGNDVEYEGYSVVLDPKGALVKEALMNQERVEVFELNAEELLSYREKFPVHLDSDNFTILD